MQKIFLNVLFVIFLLLSPIHSWAGINLSGDADYISLGDVPGTDNVQELSLCGWFNIDDVTADQRALVKFNNDQTFVLWFDTGDGADGWACQVKHSNTEIIATTGTTTASGGADQWDQVCCVWRTDDTLTIYVNAVQKDSDTGETSALNDSTEDVRIGSLQQVPQFYNGQISEIQIWNVGITANEVEQLAKSRSKRIALQVQPSALLVYSILDDFVDGTALNTDAGGYSDISGKGNAGQGVDADGDSRNIAEEVLTYP